MSGDLTIGRWLSDRARTTPDRVAIRYLDGELTYEALDRRASRLAAGLAERGLRIGELIRDLGGCEPPRDRLQRDPEPRAREERRDVVGRRAR